jgi:hypothetical protein
MVLGRHRRPGEEHDEKWVEQCKLEEHRNLGVKGKSGVLASRDSCGVPVPVRGFGQRRQQRIDRCCDRRRVLDQTPIADPQEPAQGITLGEEVFINATSTAAGTSRWRRSSTCSSASCARSSPMSRAARTASKRFGGHGYALREPCNDEFSPARACQGHTASDPQVPGESLNRWRSPCVACSRFFLNQLRC